MNFLPTDYEIPSTSKYMKFELGENAFRVLDSSVIGYEYWKTNTEGKRHPVRVHMGIDIPVAELEENPDTGELDMPKHFWAFPVWNYKDKRVEILQITQKTIQQAMKTYIANKKWGDPREYDFIVNKTKEGGKTSYTVAVNPKENPTDEMLKAYEGTPIRLEALFEGNDPFSVENEHVDPDEVKV